MCITITTLIENSGGGNGLYQEHGLSFYVQVDQHNILFDTGQSDKFLHNAEVLGVDMTTLNDVIISHRHYDHGGGYPYLVDRLQVQPTLHISKHFFIEKYALNEGAYRTKDTCIHEDAINRHHIPTELVRDKIKYIARDVFIVGNFQEQIDFEKTDNQFFIKKDGKYVRDSFRDEIALCIKTFEGLIVMVGCSHPGIVTMLTSIMKRTGESIYMVIGGTHLIHASDQRIKKTMDYFKKQDIDYIGVSHCTGETATDAMQSMKGYFLNKTGTVIHIGKYGEVSISHSDDQMP